MQAMNLLAEAGLLGRLESVAAFGKRVHSSFAAALQEAEPSQPQRWLFTAQVQTTGARHGYSAEQAGC